MTFIVFLMSVNIYSFMILSQVRWVIEAANARIKRWKYLDHILPTNQVPYIGDYVNIVCALSNKFFPPLISASQDGDHALASKMKDLSVRINTLQLEVEEKHLDRRSVKWRKPDKLLCFPRLDEQQLRDLTCGSYQLKMSTSYIQEHIDGECDIQFHQEYQNLIRVKLQSRHASSKSYMLWIIYSFNNIESWYCKCRSGARVVGVCSHVAAILWYLGFARYTQMESIGVRDWGVHVSDAANIPEIVDDSDSESDESTVEE
mgnify:FL=1